MGRCAQCSQSRKETARQIEMEIERQSIAWALTTIDAVSGFTITGPANPRWWNSDSGPDEGRTDEDVFNADPRRDPVAADFYAANRKWWVDTRQDNGPDLWNEPDDLDDLLYDLAMDDASLAELTDRYAVAN